MNIVMKFNKLSSNRWYAEVEDWPGDFEDLEMVFGADTLLDKLSNGNDCVKLGIFADEVPSSFTLCLNKYKEDIDGGYYEQHYYSDIPESVYICNVTKFVLGYFPDTIYLKKLN
jgi:hypothetical protein